MYLLVILQSCLVMILLCMLQFPLKIYSQAQFELLLFEARVRQSLESRAITLRQKWWVRALALQVSESPTRLFVRSRRTADNHTKFYAALFIIACAIFNLLCFPFCFRRRSEEFHSVTIIILEWVRCVAVFWCIALLLRFWWSNTPNNLN